jgi:hypothetical protein
LYLKVEVPCARNAAWELRGLAVSKVAFVFVTVALATQAFGQQVPSPRNPCEELPAVLKRTHDNCLLSCSRQKEANVKLPVLIAQCNTQAKASASGKTGCAEIQDYIKRVLNMNVPEGLTCR